MSATDDPYRSYNFKLDMGVAQGHFTECSGLEVEVHVLKYREAGQNQVVQNIPGRVDYGEITLRYGLTNSKELWEWFMTAVKGTVQYRNVSIVMLGPNGVDPVVTWNLTKAWPAKWRGAPLDAL